ncbi:MAG: tRNA 2-selenouridine(34) synthase MnmH [Gemmataceae bacterium]
MTQTISPTEILTQRNKFPVVDARSPSEFTLGHIPGAINVPLFDDEERKQVGIEYKQNGREQAVRLGLTFVGPRMADYVDRAKEIAPDRNLLLYCARGGMRSRSLAWLWSLAGMRVQTLQNGYKGFRRWVLQTVAAPRRYQILAAKTGSGKTWILHELARRGEQVVDLEGLANHRGSVFGSLGLSDQPTQQQFENDLAVALASMDHHRSIWLESESRRIGTIQLPQSFYERMIASKGVYLDVPLEQRVTNILLEYGNFPSDLLAERIGYIAKRLGGQRANECRQLVESGDLAQASRLLMEYYDRTYQRSFHDQFEGLADWRFVQVEVGTSIVDIAKRLGQLSASGSSQPAESLASS